MYITTMKNYNDSERIRKYVEFVNGEIIWRNLPMRLLGARLLELMAPQAIWHPEDVPQQLFKRGFFTSLPLIGNYFASQDELKYSHQVLQNIKQNFQIYKTTALGQVFAPSLDIPEAEDILRDENYGSFMTYLIILVCLVLVLLELVKNMKTEKMLETKQREHMEAMLDMEETVIQQQSEIIDCKTKCDFLNEKVALQEMELENAERMKMKLDEALKTEKKKNEDLKETVKKVEDKIRMVKELEANLQDTHNTLKIEYEKLTGNFDALIEQRASLEKENSSVKETVIQGEDIVSSKRAKRTMERNLIVSRKEFGNLFRKLLPSR
ncbi:hypothetical protein SK128_004411, partial [Halocaridina rubra]